jgi:methyl-accepting chemotaxis protein
MTLVLSVFVIGLGTFLGYLAAGDVVKTLDGLSEQAAKLAKGRYSPISGIMVDKEIRVLVDSLNSLSGSINQELEKSKMTVLETEEIINDLAQCSVELQNHADRQREILDEHGPMVTLAGDKTEQVTAAAGSIRNEAQASRDHMLEVFQHSGAAGDILRNLQEIVKGIDEASTVLVGEMEKLESNYLRMEEVVTIIDDVADRSEMVALNASLESSGSEGGRSRFSVVASEIQRLAESISRQTDAIKTIFNQVRDSSVEMVQYIEINRSKSADAPEWSSKLMQALEDIRMKSHNASGAMEKIEGRAVEQNEAVEQMRMVVGEIKSMADIMDQASSGTERTSRKLAELSQKLQEIVSLQKEKSSD